MTIIWIANYLFHLCFSEHEADFGEEKYYYFKETFLCRIAGGGSTSSACSAGRGDVSDDVADDIALDSNIHSLVRPYNRSCQFSLLIYSIYAYLLVFVTRVVIACLVKVYTLVHHNLDC